jgi:hypothetical protein
MQTINCLQLVMHLKLWGYKVEGKLRVGVQRWRESTCGVQSWKEITFGGTKSKGNYMRRYKFERKLHLGLQSWRNITLGVQSWREITCSGTKLKGNYIWGTKFKGNYMWGYKFEGKLRMGVQSWREITCKGTKLKGNYMWGYANKKGIEWLRPWKCASLDASQFHRSPCSVTRLHFYWAWRLVRIPPPQKCRVLEGNENGIPYLGAQQGPAVRDLVC